MKTMMVRDSLYGALEEAASRHGRPVQGLLNEAVESWLAEAAMDDADHSAIERYRAGKALLVAPLTLLRHHVRKAGGPDWLTAQTYLYPYPDELMQENGV